MIRRPKALAYLEALLAVTVWGATFVATKVVLREVGPVTVVWLRFAIGILILGAAVWMRGEFALPGRAELLYFTFLGFLGITFHQWLQSNGLVTASATTSAWIVATTPIFIFLLAGVFLKEGMGWMRACGILVAAAGVLLILSKGDLRSLSVMKVGTRGDFLMLVSAPNWAVFSVLSTRGLRSRPAARMMFFVMLAGWLFTSVLLLAGPGFGEIARLSGSGWIATAFLGLLASGLAYIAWYDALQSLPAAQVGAFLYFEPLVTVVLALLILGEPLTASSLIGGCLILLGVYQVNYPMAQ